MKYVLTAYEKREDSPAFGVDVSHLGREFLANLFGVPDEDFYDVYPANSEQVAELERNLKASLDNRLFDYSLEVLQGDPPTVA